MYPKYNSIGNRESISSSDKLYLQYKNIKSYSNYSKSYILDALPYGIQKQVTGGRASCQKRAPPPPMILLT